MTLAATVREAAARFGDRTALVDPDGTRTSYTELDQASDELAAGLRAEGIAEGDVVLLRLPSDSSYVVAYAAAAKLGAIAAGVNPRLAAPEQAAITAVAEPAIELTHPDQLHALRRPAVPVLLAEDLERPVALVFTSGTTGTPKGALFRGRQLAAATRFDVADAWGDAAADPTPMLASTQFAHVGFMTKLPWYLRLGTTTHILDRWRAADALDAIVEHRIPSIGGVASQMALMLREDLEARDLSHVQTIIMGGAASPPAMVREARARLGASYSIRYSSTESGGCGTATAFDADDDEALFTIGKPRPGIDVGVRDEDGQPIPDGEVGELWLRSPTVMSGYWRDDAGTAAALLDGWLRTGDLARIDERGNVVLAGRLKEMFIRGGYNVYPAEVEAVLAEHPGVADAVIVPRPDDVMGEVGVAVIVARDPHRPPTLEDVRAHLAPHVARYKLPEAVRIVDTLPLTPMQKVDRRGLAAQESQSTP